MWLFLYDFCIIVIMLPILLPGNAWIYFFTFFSTGVQKIDFGTNGVDIRDNEAIIPPFCTEFRPGLNGTSHGSKIQNYPKKKFELFYYCPSVSRYIYICLHIGAA